MNDALTASHHAMLRQQTTLARFGELALRSDDLDEILTEACRLVGHALGTDLAKVVELQEGGATLRVRAGVGWKPGVVGVVSINAAEDTSESHALKTGEPVISPDIAKETRFPYPQFLTENGVKAVANVVILGAHGRPAFGILQIDSREPRAFTHEDVAFLRSYANLVAAAVNRLRVTDEARKGEARLRASLERQQAALKTGLIGFFEWDVPAGLVTADRHFAGFHGLDPRAAQAGVPLAELRALVHPHDRASVEADAEAALACGTDYVHEFRIFPAAGAMRWLQVRGHCTERNGRRPLRYTGTATDITMTKAAEAVLRRANEGLEASVAERTSELVAANARLQAEAGERERIEGQLRQSHKMEAVGQLTGGIAHDFNNLLAGISGSLELMRAHAAQGRAAESERYIDAALTSANRAAALTHRLLAFSRRQTLDPKPTAANGLVLGVEELVRRTVGPTIGIEARLADDLWPALCDPNQLENALLNLCINARDAMPDGGQLVIETANAALPNDALEANDGFASTMSPAVPPGGYVTLSVSDTGVGMAPAVLARAFDPFFTTKPMGQGTGLGLSMIYGFVQQSGGHVRLRSAPGQGTTVTIYLPRHLGAVHEDAPPAVALALPQARMSSVVLVVEDEPSVRTVILDVLSGIGHTVLEAEDGHAGLQVVEARTRIDLLITDVGLPGGMNGRQLAEAARARRPGLKVLFVTGYAEAAAARNGVMDQGMEVMTKPFRINALAARVQGMLSG